jgi:glyoxylase I family protein
LALFKKIDHIELVTGDFDKLVDFFQKLGPTVRTTSHHGRSVEVLVGGTIFEIHQVAGDEMPGINHISFLVEGGKDELAKVRTDLVQKGVECTEVKFIKASGRYTINFRDTDGRRIQVNTSPTP